MIYLDILGRCGNQFFQYAFARRLALLNKDSITINQSLHKHYQKLMNGDLSFRDELCNFYASDNFAEIAGEKLNIRQHGSLVQRLVWKIYRRIQKLYGWMKLDGHLAQKQYRFVLAKFGIYLDCHTNAKPFTMFTNSQQNLFLNGYFEIPAYFNSIRQQLLKDFTPKLPSLSKNLTLLERINNENSVCVSFRKWEVSGRDVCNESYYDRAIDYMLAHVDSPLFVIFSNDIEWVKNNFKLPKNVIFEDGTDPIWEKMRLMYSCKHFIISNSTFAWWAQYLGRNLHKIVVSPGKWLANDKDKNALILDNFIIL